MWLTAVRRPMHSPSRTMPMLAIRKTRSVPSAHRRRSSPSTRIKGKAGASRPGKRTKMKAVESIVESGQTTVSAINTMTVLDTCPSCGLQAPEKLLAEHFLGSPSHRNFVKKEPEPDAKQVAAKSESKEDDSQQSVRNLLQILVPPRAFGLRHANRSASPISSVVQDLKPRHRHY